MSSSSTTTIPQPQHPQQQIKHTPLQFNNDTSSAGQQQTPAVIYPAASSANLYAPLEMYMALLSDGDVRTRTEAVLSLLPLLPVNHRDNASDLVYNVRKQMAVETNNDVLVLLVRLLGRLALDPYVDSTSCINFLLSSTVKLTHSKKVIVAALSAIRGIVASKNVKLALLISTAAEPLLHNSSPMVRRECLLLLGCINRAHEQESEDVQGIMVNFLKDPDYRVREAALKSLSSIFYRCGSLSVNKIYQQTTLMLVDAFEQVRLECIKLLWIISNVYPNHVLGTIGERNKSEKIRLVDDVFKKICNAVNDPSVLVRNCACKLLGCIYDVGITQLIQTLSKEILFDYDNKGRKKFQIGHSRYSKQNQQQQQQQQQPQQQGNNNNNYTHIAVPEGDIDFMSSTESSMSLVDSGATGAFIQGLEDEFYEVRSSAIDSMCELSVRNNEFAQKNIDFLVDIFTDEIESVRINSINSLRKIGHMVTIKEEQLHVILASLENSSSAERQAVHRLLTSIHVSNFSCLHATVQALLINLQKYPRDLYSIFECLSKLGSKNTSTEFIVEDLLKLDNKFASVEPNMDDIFYVAIMIVILNSAKHNNTILSLLPPFWIQHHLYFKDKYPLYFPQSLQTGGTIQEDTSSDSHTKYQLRLESQDDLSKFLKDTQALLYGNNVSSLSHQNQGIIELLRQNKHSHIVRLIEECERNLWRISSINRILKPTSDFYLMYLKLIKLIVNIKRSSIHELSQSVGRKISSLAYKMQVQFIGLDATIKTSLNGLKLVGDIVFILGSLVQSSNSSTADQQLDILRQRLSSFKSLNEKYSIETPSPVIRLLDRIQSIPKRNSIAHLEPPLKQQRIHPQSTSTDILEHLSLFIKEYEPSLLFVNNQIKRKSVNILPPPPHEKPLEYIENYPIKLAIHGNIENFPSVESLYFKIKIFDRTQLHPVPSNCLIPIKPLLFTVSSPLFINMPRRNYPKEIIPLGISIVELVPNELQLTSTTDTKSLLARMHAKDNFDPYQLVPLCKPFTFNLSQRD
ncbi:hypothetical protein SAMD00019534_106290 [Acytostelium subglobosum LB1]|uniref:hypothetical protein n=1 Tax=Acytostelium subglobosum LB1 TaxID=1410327 RepID=UPI000644B26E|nr:hypothetical protein SAMD00019534_106290 [Acytostelium subglobosum LB1]GAM27453.1 hypothetical protein SAMD00019534_106290 [Acytostelium subglobosum LB1]|eukprot:XP_012749518.1 hypothetical protein SAMD00019534_106290 [Acytostelium subglobosum LB1]